MSIEENSSVDLSESLSQGENYSHLLNDTPSQVYNFKSPRSEKPAKSSVKETLNYLEEDVNNLGQEVIKLRSQNCYLEAQIEVLTKEKEMHITAHAKEKSKLESKIKELVMKIQNDSKEQSKNLQIFHIKIQELQSELEDQKQRAQSLSKKYKSKLESKEKELMKIIRDKDKHIHQLQLQLEQGKCSRVCSFNPVHALNKRSKSKKSLNSTVKASNPLSYQSQNESQLDSISNMIVKLEKEQADLNQSFTDLNISLSGDKGKKNLQDLMQKNEERLREAKAIQQNLLKEKFSF